MHYLVKFRTEHLKNMEYVADRGEAYIDPEGDRGWAILEAEDEETLRQNFLEGQEAEEVQPVVPVREYMTIRGTREDLENAKARFVDDPSGALAEAQIC